MTKVVAIIGDGERGHPAYSFKHASVKDVASSDRAYYIAIVAFYKGWSLDALRASSIFQAGRVRVLTLVRRRRPADEESYRYFARHARRVRLSLPD